MMNRKYLYLTPLSLLFLASCDLLFGSRPGELIEDFYQTQNTNTTLEMKYYSNSSIYHLIQKHIEARNNSFGDYISRKQIGYNRNIVIKGNGREETLTYIFEVTCQNGKTRETLTILRNRSTENYQISDYDIQELPVDLDQPITDTLST